MEFGIFLTPKNKAFALKKFIKILGFLSVLFGSALFVHANILAYLSKETSIIFSQEIVNSFDNPAITFCFDPIAKLSKLKQYNITEGLFANANINQDIKNKIILFPIPWPEIYYDSSFRLGVDFYFTIMIRRLGKTFRINDDNFTSEQKSLFEVEEIHTFWGGLCTKLRIKLPILPSNGNLLKLIFKKNLQINDTPNVFVYYSSEENSSKSSILMKKPKHLVCISSNHL